MRIALKILDLAIKLVPAILEIWKRRGYGKRKQNSQKNGEP